jgi:hypothetical protein
MVKIFCDRCGRQLEADKTHKCLQLHLKESKYKGELNFYKDTECFETSVILCPVCAEKIEDVLAPKPRDPLRF